MIPIVTFAHANDSLAARVHSTLEQRLGAAQVHLLSAEALGAAGLWHHELCCGQVASRVELHSGLILKEDQPFVLFNRIRYALMTHFQASSEYDRSYAISEMHALLLSWLHSLGGRVVNPPVPPELCGRNYSRIEALYVAAKAGLDTASYGFSSHPRTLKLNEGEYRFRRIEAEVTNGEQNLLTDTAPAPEDIPTVASDCLFGEEVSVVIAGRHRTRLDIPLPTVALAQLQALGGHSIMELRLAHGLDGRWKVSHLCAFPEQDDWESAGVIAEFLAERALSGGRL